jgi:TonB family protein
MTSMTKGIHSVKASTRLFTSVASALAISLGLFYFMNQLISGGSALKKSDDTENFIEFVRIKRPSHTESRKRKMPKKPKPQEKMMDTKQMNQPIYPRDAQMNGVTGFVKLGFDVMPDGTAANVRVLKSKPPRVFDMAATKAALKAKFKPKYEDGKPVKQKNKYKIYDFKLE